ncbi:hypothetical protein ACFWPJ_33375, partial [Nocardia sp. NPDC058497]
ELEGSHGSLDGFDCGDDATNVRAAFAYSYRGLRAPAARLFRLLALHAGPAISVHSAARLAAQPPSVTGKLLAELVQANLVIERVSGSFVLPTLVRLYARELSEESDGGLAELLGSAPAAPVPQPTPTRESPTRLISISASCEKQSKLPERAFR